LAGGGDSILWRSLPTAALYDAVTDSLRPIGNMTTSRFLHTATLLPDSTVLITGGDASATRTQARSFTIPKGKLSLRLAI
jgi:hypothetical protein